jgi:hypothetical protein
VQKPSNVAVYLTVNDGKNPVTDLTEQSFAIYENDQLVSIEDGGQVLLDRTLAAHFRTLLLVDVSSAKDEGARARLARAVASFVAAVRRTQAVTVYAFDGSADLRSVGDFPRGGDGPTDLPELASAAPRDSSRNLNGAVQSGLKELGARLMTERKSVRVGTLVVLATGPDLAGRVSADQLAQAVDASPYQMLAVAVGQEGSFEIAPLDKNGALWAPSLNGIGPTLDDAASKVEDLMERHYLLAYCSPARAGVRRVRVEVLRVGTEGEERKGSLSFEFDATGFGPGCNASTPPRFGASGGDAEEPKANGEPKQDGSKGNGGAGAKPGDKPADKKPGDDIVPPPNKPGYAPQAPSK